jgi:hypothetical protein
MIDPELEKTLKEINNNLIQIKKKTKNGIWHAFFHGMFSALGYVVGLAVVVVVLGWFLQKSGLLDSFKKQAANFQSLIDQAKKLTSPEKQGSGTTVVLPNGREVKIK